MLHPHQHCRGGPRQVPHDRGPQPAESAGGFRGQRSTILVAAWRIASAVTPAPLGGPPRPGWSLRVTAPLIRGAVTRNHGDVHAVAPDAGTSTERPGL